ncbi:MULTISPECIES: helicase-associated domain-containing protein [unclassified Leucobacter]|uniref:helicase-associated domain-containing protein n=1 Tax=unclassified Leucobacter TaxID=2621730 RepID=UPI00165E85D8|nr:helicase-associated domain-containing protein [Leucobacter sp. CX169]MBC9928634.1 helicase-associated domain-containing protein [Leucobacter sp. cx-169]
MSGTLALAGAIASLDRAALTRLVGTRPPSGPTAIQDPIGLATALLRPDSLSRALAAADRGTLADIARLGRGESLAADAAESLRSLGLAGLLGGVTVPLPEVTTALERALTAATIDVADLDHAALPSPTVSVEPSAPGRADHWVEPAFTLTQRAAAILRALTGTPGHVRRRGVVAAITVKALAAAAHTEPSSVIRILPMLSLAGLTTVPERAGNSDSDGSRPLVVTPRAADWLRLPHPERWLELATALLAGMPLAVRGLLTEPGASLDSATGSGLRDRFPLATDEVREAAAEYCASADEAGFAPWGQLSEPAAALLAGDWDRAHEIVSSAFPAPVNGVYVQPDLSVVAPGPLRPDDEQRLIELADLEQLGIAAVFRLSSSSLTRALDRGWTGEEAREFLEHLSLTGIPQPLAYLLDEVEARHGSIIVAAHNGDGARSRITAERPELLDAMLVDRSLQHLRLTRLERAAKPIALSRLSPEHVAAALADARYPVTVPGSHQGPPADRCAAQAAPRMAPFAPSEIPDHAPLSPALEAMVSRVSAAAESQPEAGDFVRILELAIRDRTVMDLVVHASGRDWPLRMLPHAVANGRVRGIDPGADVERTLPLASLVSVAPVQDADGAL